MTELSVDPEHLHSIAARLRALGGDTDRLTQHSAAGQSAPTAADFPRADFGQHAGRLWDDARPVFTQALALVGQMITRTASDFSATATQYAATDQASADRVRRAGR